MDPISALSAIQGALDLTKAAYSEIRVIGDTNAALKTIDLQQDMLDLKEKLLAAREAITNLIQENQELRSQLQTANKLEHNENGNILWRVIEGRKRGPYCSTCYGASRKVISLSSVDDGSWCCPRCKNRYRTNEWRNEIIQKHQRLKDRSSKWSF